MSIKITQQTIDFIVSWEGFSPTAYWDYQQWTIGYGTKGYEGQTITPQEAEDALRVDLEQRAKRLEQQLTVALTPNQTTAFLDAAFNLGSVPSPCILYANSNQWQEAADELRKYCHAGGEKLPALVRRREQESRLIEVDIMKGEPRVQYDRVYHLVGPDASIDEFVEAAKKVYETKGTIGFSADDAGIGNLDSREVVLHGEQPEGIEEWFNEHYSGVKVTDGDLIEKPIETPKPPVFEPSSALWGLHASADGNWGNPISDVVQRQIKVARIQAYKALSNESSMSIPIVKGINPDCFIMVRLFSKVNSENCFSDDFIRSVSSDARSWYNNGVRYFEVHNEPNLQIEGMWDVWRDGAEFASWFHRVVHHLKADMPEAQFGYPGLSPGFAIEGVRYNPMRFWRESHSAFNEADWIGVHCYWQHEDEIRSTDGGHWFKNIQSDVSGKPMLITEFSNPSATVSKEVKAHQYNTYISTLQNTGIHSAYCFISTASSGFEHETWNDSPIPNIVGSRNYGKHN